MAASSLILQRYAHALHDLAQRDGAVPAVRASLAALAARLDAEPALSRPLHSPQVTRARKRELLLAALGPACPDLVRRAVLLLVDKGRAGLAGEFGPVFAEVARAAAGEAVARVQSAAALDDGTRTNLRRQLEQLTRRSITLQEEVSAELLGGLRVVVGSRMIDGTVARRLERMQARLLAVPLAGAGERLP